MRRKKMDTVARKGRIKIGEKKVMSSQECSLVKVVISCVATACPKDLQRDKMNMECCPVKKEEKKSEHTCGGKVSLSLDSKRRNTGREQRSGGARAVAGPHGGGACGRQTVVHTVLCCHQKATMQPPLDDTFCVARKVESPMSSFECKPKNNSMETQIGKNVFNSTPFFRDSGIGKCCTGRKFERRPGKLPTREREKSATNIWG